MLLSRAPDRRVTVNPKRGLRNRLRKRLRMLGNTMSTLVFVVGICFGIAIILGMLVYTVFSLSSLVVMPFGAPYVPCNEENRKRLRAIVRGRKRVVDLGSGDGRVVCDLAASNKLVHGYELNPILVWKSRRALRKSGFSERTRVFRRNFWNHSFGEYDAVCVYGISYIMKRLERKLLDELRPGAMVVSVGFAFPNWEPVREEGAVRIYEKS